LLSTSVLPKIEAMAQADRVGPFIALALLVACGGCTSFGARAYGGYFEPKIEGEVSLEPSFAGGLLGTRTVDLESDLGIDEADASVWGRVEIQPWLGRLTVSAFQFDQEGQGTLSRGFGDIPPGAVVESAVTLTNVKASYTLDVLDTGVVRLSPGVAVDYLHLEASVRSVTPISAFEEIDAQAPVPMVHLQGALELGILALDLEGGWMSLDLGDADGTFWDVEGMLRLVPWRHFELIAGYRFISVEGDGNADGQRFEADLDLSGWYAGGGVRF
jgi:hypothetical protein